MKKIFYFKQIGLKAVIFFCIILFENIKYAWGDHLKKSEILVDTQKEKGYVHDYA
jgi:hypothetical protein